MEIVFGISITAILMVVGYITGSYLERRHFEELHEREDLFQRLPVVTFATLPAGWEPTDSSLVIGNVVVSVDYFKRFIAGLRMFFGGRVKAYEPLLDRGRREALLRMAEQAAALDFDAVVNVRLQTSPLANAGRGGKESTAGIEILAFGTALRLT